MSVNLALLPVALAVGLAMRLVMGKDKYEAWLESLQIKIPTNFQNEGDLIQTIKKAGYDAEKWGGSIKTHFKGRKGFCFWELLGEKWIAVFAKSDAKDLVMDFIKDLEANSRRQIFLINEETNKVAVMPSRTFPTDFRDSDILLRALAEHGLNPKQAGSDIHVKIGSTDLLFRQEPGFAFNVEIRNPTDMHGIFSQLLLLDEDYKRYVQAITYEKVKQRAKEKGLLIESEEVLADNSIMLTLLVT